MSPNTKNPLKEIIREHPEGLSYAEAGTRHEPHSRLKTRADILCQSSDFFHARQAALAHRRDGAFQLPGSPYGIARDRLCRTACENIPESGMRRDSMVFRAAPVRRQRAYSSSTSDDVTPAMVLPPRCGTTCSRKGEVLTQAVDEVAEGALGAAEKVVKRTGKHIGDTVPKNLKGSAKKHRENEQAIADDLKGIGDKNVYHVNDRGEMTRLSSSGHQPLTDDDRRRLAPLGLQGDSVGKRSRKDYPLPAPGDRTRKSSEQVGFGESDLARATRAARNVNEDYGTEHKDGRFTSRNYAAVRHGESGSEEEFILVGRSKFPGAHSEDQVGIPFLNSGSEGGLTELYTEREPCTSGKGAMDCSAWMGEHLPGDMKVSHSVEYGNTEGSKQQGNQEMREYLVGLRSGGK